MEKLTLVFPRIHIYIEQTLLLSVTIAAITTSNYICKQLSLQVFMALETERKIKCAFGEIAG